MKTINVWMLLGGVGLGMLMGKPAWSQTRQEVTIKEKRMVRIKLKDDKDGKVRDIDTTFEAGPDFDMNAWMRSMNIEINLMGDEDRRVFKKEHDALYPPEDIMQIPEVEGMVIGKIPVPIPCDPADKDCFMNWLENDSLMKEITTGDPENMPEGEKVKVYKFDDGKGNTKVVVNKVVVKRVDSKTDTKEARSLKADVYPNPGNGVFTIDVSVPAKGNAGLEITDKEGKVIYSREIQSSGKREVDITSQGKGTYFLNLKQGKKKFQQKIMVN